MMTGLGVGSGSFVWMLIFWVIILGGSFWLLAALFPKRPADQANTRKQSDESALTILQQRYARGEITRQEFEAIRSDLERA